MKAPATTSFFLFLFFDLAYSRWTCVIITILPVVTITKDLPISPRFTPYDFFSRCKFSNLTTRQPMILCRRPDSHMCFSFFFLKMSLFLSIFYTIPPFSLSWRVCVCFLPIHSGHQVRWTYQPGSHRRKVTQDFSSTFFLRCVP